MRCRDREEQKRVVPRGLWRWPLSEQRMGGREERRGLLWRKEVPGLGQQVKDVVFLCSDFFNKIPQTGWLINNRNLSLTVLEAGSLRSGQQHGQVRAGSQPAPSGWVLTRRKGRGSSLVSLL